MISVFSSSLCVYYHSNTFYHSFPGFKKMPPKQKGHNKCGSKNNREIAYNRVFFMRSEYRFLDTFYPITSQSQIIIQPYQYLVSPAPAQPYFLQNCGDFLLNSHGFYYIIVYNQLIIFYFIITSRVDRHHIVAYVNF